MTLYIIAILFGLALLIYSANRFIEGAASIATHLAVSPLIIGLLILGFGTSAPEIMVSIFASLSDNPELAFGNAIGSNIANIALVLGVSAIIGNISVQPQVLKREFPILLLATVIFWLLVMDFTVSFFDSLILLSLLFASLFWMVWRNHSENTLTKNLEKETPKISLKMSWFWTIIGLIFLLVSSKILVWGASKIAHLFGISDLIIGLTVVAIGTSLPELAAGITAVLKKEHSMAIGNVIGSNLFNLLAVVGVSGIISPYSIPSVALNRDFLIMVGLTLFLYFVLFLGKLVINRTHGLILSLSFVLYLSLLAKNIT